MKARVLFTRLVLVLAIVVIGGHAQAQAPITLIVPYAKDGPTDKIATPLASELARILGEQVVLRYLTGEGGTRGPTQMLNDGDASGRTLLIHHIGMATAPTLYRKLAYSPLEDFLPIGRIADAPMVVLARVGLLPGDQSLAAYIRANQGKLMLAYAGAGSASQMCSLLLESALRVRLTWIPYRGTGPAMKDLAARRVDLLCDQTTQAIPALANDKVVGYALTVSQRLAMRPDIPTTTEVGMGDVQLSIWHGLYALKGTDPPIIERLSAALQEAVGSASFVAAMTQVGVVPATSAQATPAALRRLVFDETIRWRPLIRAAAQYAD